MGRGIDVTIARSKLNKNEKPSLYSILPTVYCKKLLFPFFRF